MLWVYFVNIVCLLPEKCCKVFDVKWTGRNEFLNGIYIQDKGTVNEGHYWTSENGKHAIWYGSIEDKCKHDF